MSRLAVRQHLRWPRSAGCLPGRARPAAQLAGALGFRAPARLTALALLAPRPSGLSSHTARGLSWFPGLGIRTRTRPPAFLGLSSLIPACGTPLPPEAQEPIPYTNFFIQGHMWVCVHSQMQVKATTATERGMLCACSNVYPTGLSEEPDLN